MRAGIDDEQARIGGLEPSEPEIHRPQVCTVVVLNQRLREHARRRGRAPRLGTNSDELTWPDLYERFENEGHKGSKLLDAIGLR